MSTTTTSSHTSRAEREIRLSWIFFALTFITFILSGIWSIVVGTASPGANESDLIQGWEGVLRNLPGYLLLVVVASLWTFFVINAVVVACVYLVASHRIGRASSR